MKCNCNCNCNCECCFRYLRSLSVKADDTNTTLIITIPKIDLYEDRDFCMVICQSIPRNAILNSYKVKIILEGEATGKERTTLNRIGNNLRADQIRTRKLYYMVYGTDPEHFLLRNRVPESNGAPSTV